MECQRRLEYTKGLVGRVQKGNEEGKQTKPDKDPKTRKSMEFSGTQGKFVWLEYREQVGRAVGRDQVGAEEPASMSPL